MRHIHAVQNESRKYRLIHNSSFSFIFHDDGQFVGVERVVVDRDRPRSRRRGDQNLPTLAFSEVHEIGVAVDLEVHVLSFRS